MKDDQITPSQCIYIVIKVVISAISVWAFPYICAFSFAVVLDLGLWEYFAACLVLLIYLTVLSLLFLKPLKQAALTLFILWLLLIIACSINYVIVA